MPDRRLREAAVFYAQAVRREASAALAVADARTELDRAHLRERGAKADLAAARSALSAARDDGDGGPDDA